MHVHSAVDRLSWCNKQKLQTAGWTEYDYGDWKLLVTWDVANGITDMTEGRLVWYHTRSYSLQQELRFMAVHNTNLYRINNLEEATTKITLWSRCTPTLPQIWNQEGYKY